MPPVRLFLLHQERAQCRRLPALALQGVREDVLVQEQGPARRLQARCHGLGALRGSSAFGPRPEAVREDVPCVPQDLLVHAHEALRGYGAPASRLQDRTFGLLAGSGACLGESLTGDRAGSAARMPGKPRRHGGAVHARGISSLKACVICGANDAGDGLCRVADRGRPKDEALRDAIKGLGPGTWVATDAHQGCRRVLPALGIAEHAATDTRLQKDGELGMASAMHQRLRIFLAPFHGVSTKWPDYCLSWFL